MPYLEVAKKAELQDNYKPAREPGELNFLITLMLIEGWKVSPRYSTLAKMYKDFVLSPEKNDPLTQFYYSLENPAVTRQDIFTAAAMAFFEFYRRVGQVYETIKILENGDVYDEITKPMLKHLDELVKLRKEPLPIIVPGR